MVAAQGRISLFLIIGLIPLELLMIGFFTPPSRHRQTSYASRQLPLLVTLVSLAPILLLLYALHQNILTTDVVRDVNLSGSLRYRSLWLYGETQSNDSRDPATWELTLQEMEDVRSTLRAKYPDEVLVMDDAWNAMRSSLQQTGRLDWQTANQMRIAANNLTLAIERHAERHDRQVIYLIAIGLLCLILGTVKTFAVVRQLRRAETELAESELRFKQLSEAAFESILVTDGGIVVDANSHFCRMFGYTLAETIGKRVLDFIAPESRDLVNNITAHGHEQLYEAYCQRKDGTMFVAEVEGKNTLYHGRSARVKALRDITERKQQEAQLAIQQQTLHELNLKLAALATHDDLTGLKNRRAFWEQLQAEFCRALRHDTPLSLVLLDVDAFKYYNDTFGHPAGDAVLQQVGQLLQATCRSNDVVARYGGEEFVMVLPHTDLPGAMALAERCRAAIAEADWSLRTITASFGVATLTSSTPDATALLASADAALYTSKSSGRNCVTSSSGPLATWVVA